MTGAVLLGGASQPNPSPFVWATVTTASTDGDTCKVLVDGNTTPVTAYAPPNNTSVRGLRVNQRVLVFSKGPRLYLLGDFVTDDTGWLEVSSLGFSNGWVNFGDARTAQYRRIGNRVSLRGLIKNGSIGAFAAFTLPAGFRPPTRNSYDGYFACTGSNAYACVAVDGASGAVLVVAAVNNAWIDLSGVSFCTD